MADYGVTTTGFELKRLEDIKASVESALVASFGEIDTAPDSVFGQLIGVFSRALAEVWEQSENVYNSRYPSSAEGAHLDEAAYFTGITRLPAAPSTAVVQLRGDDTTVIPVNTLFSQVATKEQFKVTTEATISTNTLHKTKITVTTAANSTAYTVTINGTDVTITSSGAATKPAIAAILSAAINAAELGVTSVYVATTEYITITSDLLSLTDTFTAAVGARLEFTDIWTPAAVESSNNGRISVPVGSISVIDTPVVGLDEVTNIAEGSVGAEAETDTAFRIRRRKSLGLVSAGTLDSIVARVLNDIPEVTAAFIFENTTGAYDGDRPPHSFELVVAAPDTSPVNQAIADKVWERKPAGILSFGDTSVNVTDTNGDTQVVSFTHAGTKYVHLRLTYDRTGSEQVFPLDGEALIAEELLRLGNTLTFGSDILVQKFAGAGYIVDGVADVTMEMAVTDAPGDTPTWVSTNISIATADFPSFDATRIFVQEA